MAKKAKRYELGQEEEDSTGCRSSGVSVAAFSKGAQVVLPLAITLHRKTATPAVTQVNGLLGKEWCEETWLLCYYGDFTEAARTI